MHFWLLVHMVRAMPGLVKRHCLFIHTCEVTSSILTRRMLHMMIMSRIFQRFDLVLHGLFPHIQVVHRKFLV